MLLLCIYTTVLGPNCANCIIKGHYILLISHTTLTLETYINHRGCDDPTIKIPAMYTLNKLSVICPCKKDLTKAHDRCTVDESRVMYYIVFDCFPSFHFCNSSIVDLNSMDIARHETGEASAAQKFYRNIFVFQINWKSKVSNSTSPSLNLPHHVIHLPRLSFDFATPLNRE